MGVVGLWGCGAVGLWVLWGLWGYGLVPFPFDSANW